MFLYYFALINLLVISLSLAYTSTINKDTAVEFVEEIKEQLPRNWYGIFSNNLIIYLLSCVPITGGFYCLFILSNTSYAVSAFSVYSGFPITRFLLTLYMEPHTIVEMSAYTCALIFQHRLLRTLIDTRKHGVNSALREMLKVLRSEWKLVFLGIFLLFFASVIEHMLIKGIL